MASSHSTDDRDISATPENSSTGTAPRKSSTKKAASKKGVGKKAAGKKASENKASSKQASASKAAPDPVPASLQHMPASLFGAGLGLAGFATAWREASVAFGVGGFLATVLAGIAFGIFVALVAIYAVKILRHPGAAKAEFRHPIQGNFFAAATMTAMVLSTNIVVSLPGIATAVWAVAALANLAITVTIVTFWISRDCHVSYAAPVWFIPVVGNLVIPIVGVPLGFADIGWMMFAVGLLFWLVLFTIVFYRLLFERPMEGPLRPTLFILIAPPSLCFIAYAVLNGGVVDGPATMFLGLALFTLLVLLPQVPSLLKLPFGLSWWSYTFPLAALSVACTLYADAVGGVVAQILAIAVLVILTVAVLGVTVWTARYIMAGKVFLPTEPPLPKS